MDSSLIQIKRPVIPKPLQPPERSRFLRISFTSEPSFGPPLLPLGPRPDESNESHMHAHFASHMNSPLLKTVRPRRLPPTMHFSSLLFPKPFVVVLFFSVVTLSVPAPPSKAKKSGCQSKQATCVQTHQRLA